MKPGAPKTMILGGAGFIGSNAAAEFIEMGAKVSIIDGFMPHTGGNPDNIRRFAESVRLITNPIEKIANLSQLIADTDLIIDAMGMTSHHYGMAHPFVDIEMNLHAHLHLIRALENTKGVNVIYLGSRGQYGKTNTPRITEETPLHPMDVQGVAKHAAETLYQIYAKKFGFNIISLRITNCFGENQKTQDDDIGLMGMIIRDILSGKPVKIYGDTTRKKNFIYVKDLVKIIARISCDDFATFEAYNIAGIEVSMKALLDETIRIVGTGEYQIHDFPGHIENMDVGQSRFDDTKFRTKYGAFHHTDLGTSLKNTINYFRKKYQARSG